MDSSKRISDFHIINENVCTLEYDFQENEVPDTPTGNVVIAAFTTCWARLHLLEVLYQVGQSCLYYDTDSVIYVDREEDPCPVKLGDYLGELTNELKPGIYIEEFISGGPKNYAYTTSDGDECCKIRGFTLNHRNSQLLNFETMKQLVTHQSGQKIILDPETKIVRDKKRRLVYNTQQKKDYQMVYTKRRKLNNDTVPYGY